jgi:uncharacterized membrane protein
MKGLLHHFALSAKARTGLSVGVLVWAVIATISIVATIVFFLIAAFVAIARRYDAQIAGLALGGIFLVMAIIALVACLMIRRHNIEQPVGARPSDRARNRMAAARLIRRRRRSGGRAGEGMDEPRSGALRTRHRRIVPGILIC